MPESYNKCNPQHSTGVIFTRSKYRLQGHDSDSMGLESCCLDTNHFSSSYSLCCAVLCLVAPLCLTLRSHGLQPASLLCHWGFSRQEYWSRLPCPPPGDLPDPGIKPVSLKALVLTGKFFTSSTT